MTGLSHRLASAPIKSDEQLLQAYDSLLANTTYRDAVETGTSQEANVTTRLDEAKKAFAVVK